MITQIVGFIVMILIFRKLFDMLDQIGDNHRRKQQLLEMKILYARAERALLVRQAWERHQLRKEKKWHYADINHEEMIKEEK